MYSWDNEIFCIKALKNILRVVLSKNFNSEIPHLIKVLTHGIRGLIKAEFSSNEV